MKHFEVSEYEWKKWLAAAKPGECVVYTRGRTSINPNDIKRTAYDAYRSGLVELVQRRHGDDDYSYIAIRRG